MRKVFFFFLIPVFLGAQKMQVTFPAMGTKWKIVIPQGKELKIEEIFKEATRLVLQMDSLWSNFIPQSEINVLSRNSGKDTFIKVHPWTYELVENAKDLYRLSEGKFDVTIGPLTKRWRRSFNLQSLPDSFLIAKESDLVSSDNLILQPPHWAKLSKAKMSIDLGGIAKGFAIDRLAGFLENKGFVTYLIDAGGDIRVSSENDDWNILLPNGKSIKLKNGAIASSGSTFQNIQRQDTTYGHHIDPKTGWSSTNEQIITVIAKECWIADAFSTWLMLAPNAQFEHKDWEVYKIIRTP